MTAKFTGHFSPVVPPFPATGLSLRCRRGGSWWRKLELLKPGFVQQAYGCSTSGGISHRGPMEEEEEEYGLLKLITLVHTTYACLQKSLNIHVICSKTTICEPPGLTLKHF
jgi:hypothetical protein